MKTILKNTLTLAIALTLFAACSKFEDGPDISLRSIEKRIYGLYRIEYFSKNGTDLTDYWNQYYDITFKFYRDWDGSWPDIYGLTVKGYIDSVGVMKYFSAYSHHFYFNDDDKVTLDMANIVFDSTRYPNRELFPLITYWGNSPEESYDITRLTNDEMWLELENGSDFYEVHLKENL